METKWFQDQWKFYGKNLVVKTISCSINSGSIFLLSSLVKNLITSNYNILAGKGAGFSYNWGEQVLLITLETSAMQYSNKSFMLTSKEYVKSFTCSLANGYELPYCSYISKPKTKFQLSEDTSYIGIKSAIKVSFKYLIDELLVNYPFTSRLFKMMKLPLRSVVTKGALRLFGIGSITETQKNPKQLIENVKSYDIDPSTLNNTVNEMTCFKDGVANTATSQATEYFASGITRNQWLMACSDCSKQPI